MKYVWISEAFIVTQLLFLWALLIYTIFPFTGEFIEGVPNRVLIIGSIVLLAFIVLIAVMIGAELYYRNFEYDFTEDSFVVRKGAVTRKEYIIPYKEIESAKVLRSGVHALDQVFGLTCVKVVAGGRSIIIPGIAEPELFLRRLMAHVEGNDVIKNSELYLSERETLLKLVADVRHLHTKVEQFIADGRRAQAVQRAQDSPTEFMRPIERDVERLLDIKTFGGSNSKPKRGRKKGGKDD